MITHLEPDILECEVKWALGSIPLNKASRGDGIPAELFQILKDDAVKVLHSICQQLENLAIGLENICFHSNPKERQCQKNVQTTTQLHSFHMLARLFSKFSKLGFDSIWTENFQIYTLDLEKAEEPNCQHPLDHRKSKRIPGKHLLLLRWLS